MSSIKVGDEVLFGRPNGEKTKGRVVKVNASSVKVTQLEVRGGKPVGTEWRVHPSLVFPLDAKPALPALAPLLPIPPVASTPSQVFRVGQRVAFTDTRRARTVTGTVERINSKTVTVVNCDDGSRGWRVSPAMLVDANGPGRM